MEQFPHLKFFQKVTGKPRFYGGGSENPITKENKVNRQAHGNFLQQQTGKLKSDWDNSLKKRQSEALADINENTTPIFLQINPDLINAEFDLESFGIEIISEEENGFIIGASFDNLKSLEEKINGFISQEHGTGGIADFWQIIGGEREIWKPKHILSEYLFSYWNKIQDTDNYLVEVSVAFAKPIGKEPDASKQGGEARLKKYREDLIKRDDILVERQTHFERFIKYYGEIKSSFVELEDSFSCQVLITGKGLKDLVINYQYVFEVSEIDEVKGIEGQGSDLNEIDVDIISPDDDSTIVGVIDSGIMENHKYISLAIKGDSKSYVEGDNSTADYVNGGGHGTKVAGAILYPKGISKVESSYKLPCFIRNLRVLDKDNHLQHKYPASLMDVIVDENADCKIFNLSVTSNAQCRKKHMSSWAAIIDKLTFENDILFLISVGNIGFHDIQSFIKDGKEYPEYLDEMFCHIANPSQSLFGLSVGSMNISAFEDENWISLGDDNDISAFSRIGTGIWDTIKPDVVEYGGSLIISKNGDNLVKQNSTTSPELLRSTLHGGSAIGQDSVGTSFSTPKVAHIAAIIKQLYPEEGVNLIRAFIVQGARLPKDYFRNPTKKSIQYFGYGLPSLERVVKNTDYRVTFYNTGKIMAEEGHLYSLKIPESIRGQGDEFDILIEITLSYTSQIRRTRQKTKSYLSTWLDWTSSKIDEPYDKFKDFILKEINGSETSYDKEERKKLTGFNWHIKTRVDNGKVLGISRSNSSLQKDWTILKSYELPEEISIAICGHKGWDKNKMEIPYAITVSFEVLGTDIPIYENFRIENEIDIESEVFY
ncbi:MAG: S8 family peptidase [Bacteroidales bacterium]|nr:S8 family peptidase [Bacteroidales bacterium]